MTKPIAKSAIVRSHYPKGTTLMQDALKSITNLKPGQVFVYTGTYSEQRVLTEDEAMRLYFYKNELHVMPSGGDPDKAKRTTDDSGQAKGPLPTKGAAHLALIQACERYAGRQSEDTFMLLVNALATARAVKLY